MSKKWKEREWHDVAMMADDSCWPSLQLLPLKRFIPGKKSLSPDEYGVLGAGRGPIVYTGDEILSLKDCTTDKAKEYPTFQAVWNDGWMVD